MSEFPGHSNFVPPHIPPQHTPRVPHKRRPKPPAGLSKLHRPLTRFYCNDCKKKFRSRILANRNNNAVQHYCSLYSKIITRKVDSHSNKCKGDHGMGPCVVKRTDTDPDSDGEDETKAAYYADKGKKRPSTKRRSRGAYTKKRKRDDEYIPPDISNPPKRQRRNHNHGPPPPEPVNSYGYFPPPTNADGYYHPNGYMQPSDGTYNRYYMNQPPPTPPIVPPHHNGNGHHTLPPPPEYNDGDIASTPPIPMALSTELSHTDSQYDHVMPPPPALEPIEMPNGSANGLNTNTNTHETNHVNNEDLVVTVVKHPVTGSMVDIAEVESDHKTNANQEKQEETSMIHVETKGKDEEENSSSKVEEDDGGECINDGNTDDGEEEDFLPDLTVPLDSPSPSSKHSAKHEDVDTKAEAEEEDEDELNINLDVPQ